MVGSKGFGVLVSGLLHGCVFGSDCNRDGCDALNVRVRGSGRSGVAGVVAQTSDVVSNGCQECPFAAARLDFWTITTEVTSDAETIATVQAGPPTAGVEADAHYSLALDPGTYLACTQLECVNVTVQANEVTTVNVKQRFGPTGFFIFNPGSSEASEVFGFSNQPE